MNDDKLMSELLKKKFEPFSDEKRTTPDITQTLKSLFNETVDQAQKRKEALEKALGPLTEEARAKIGDMAGLVEEAAVKSSNEARTFLAKVLEAMAGKLKP